MKKKFIKLMSLTLAAAMSMAVLAGCGSSTDDEGTDVAESTAAATTDSDTLIMGTNAAFPPFEYVTTNSTVDGVGDFDGIDVVIAKQIADKLGKTLVIEDMEFEGLIASVQTGKIDIAVAGMTVTDERLEKVDFSDTYFIAAQIMVVPEDSGITTAQDLLNDKKVGVVVGYTGDLIVTEDLGVAEENITRANRAIDVVQDVKNGKLDAVVVDSATGKALAERNGLKVVEDPEAFEAEEYAIAVEKGNTELLDAINEVLAELKANGDIDALAEKYNNIEA